MSLSNIMTGHRFDSRTRDFDITIFTSERVWEIKDIRILVTLLAWFFGFGFIAVCGFSPLSAFIFFGPRPKKKDPRGLSELVYNNFLFRTG